MAAELPKHALLLLLSFSSLASWVVCVRLGSVFDVVLVVLRVVLGRLVGVGVGVGVVAVLRLQPQPRRVDCTFLRQCVVVVALCARPWHEWKGVGAGGWEGDR